MITAIINYILTQSAYPRSFKGVHDSVFLFHVGILLPRSAALEKSAVPTAAGTPDFMIAPSKTHINQHFDSSNVDDDAT